MIYSRMLGLRLTRVGVCKSASEPLIIVSIHQLISTCFYAMASFTCYNQMLIYSSSIDLQNLIYIISLLYRCTRTVWIICVACVLRQCAVTPSLAHSSVGSEMANLLYISGKPPDYREQNVFRVTAFIHSVLNLLGQTEGVKIIIIVASFVCYQMLKCYFAFSYSSRKPVDFSRS